MRCARCRRRPPFHMVCLALRRLAQRGRGAAASRRRGRRERVPAHAMRARGSAAASAPVELPGPCVSTTDLASPRWKGPRGARHRGHRPASCVARDKVVQVRDAGPSVGASRSTPVVVGTMRSTRRSRFDAHTEPCTRGKSKAIRRSLARIFGIRVQQVPRAAGRRAGITNRELATA